MTIAEQIRRASYHLRLASSADAAFLLELYAQGREAEMMLAGMDATQRALFVQMQFRARQAGYAASYPAALDEMICLDNGSAAGRVLVDRACGEVRLVDIAIAHEWQRQGIGTAIIRALQQECRTQRCELKLQVLKESVAERLYRRLGFSVAGEDLLRRQMVWSGARD